MAPQNGSLMPLRSYANGSVATTWMVSYRAVSSRSLDAANLLLLWAHLNNRSLWYGLLSPASRKSTVAAEYISNWIGEVGRDEMEFLKAIELLRRYSLVDATEDQTGYTTHPVVHQWALHIQSNSQRKAFSCMAVIMVGHAVPTIYLTHARTTRDLQFETETRLLPHAWECETIVDRFIRGRVGELWQTWHYPQIWEVMPALHGLAILFGDQGRLDKGEKMLLLALEGYEKVFGPEHPMTVIMMKNVAVLYADLGKLEEAEKMERALLVLKQKLRGPEHLDTFAAFNGIGIICAKLYKDNEAEEMFQHALHGLLKVLEPNHPDVVAVYSNLGNLYVTMGRLDEAEDMLERAVQGRKEVKREWDEKMLIVMRNLGDLYKLQGKIEEAEDMYKRVLQAYEKAIGEGRMSSYMPSLNAMWSYADFLIYDGRVEDARFWYSKALLGFQNLIGPENPKCIDIQESLDALDKRT